MAAPAATVWHQRELALPARRRGLHPITSLVEQSLPELGEIAAGLLHVFICHTSASLTISENADPDVPADMERGLNHLVPENFPWQHTCEGPDDMPAHLKASLMSSSVMVPVRHGRLCLGVWQGLFLCEHRDRASSRRLILTLQGTTESPEG
ncbi:MAG: secondary thiamine-phosphate synthase enzyme YjbQ [Planctomycetaceae bacterium]|nr:secondary thiamine-phosphate synthase enzyme YjbQ [Planctomycetaceae bacterium]